MRHIAVVGASLAGYRAAQTLRQEGFDGTITLIGAEPHRPYDRPPLSKRALTHGLEVSDLTIEREGEALDLDWRLCPEAKAAGVLVEIGPDAHSTQGLDNVEYGIGIARKGWLGREHVINSWTAEELLAWRK